MLLAILCNIQVRFVLNVVRCPVVLALSLNCVAEEMIGYYINGQSCISTATSYQTFKTGTNTCIFKSYHIIKQRSAGMKAF